MRRVIVPPLMTKSYADDTFMLIWREAARRIAQADRLVVIGYSLPSADFPSRILFTTAVNVLFRLTNSSRSLAVVDPSPDARERLRRILGCDEYKGYESIGSFLSDEQGQTEPKQPPKKVRAESVSC